MSESLKYNGYWISPSGKTFEFEADPFLSVWSNPGLFELNKDRMEELYQKFDDEQQTIHAIIDDLIEKHWILCLKKTLYWQIHAISFNRKTADQIWEWVYHILDEKRSEISVFDSIKLCFQDDRSHVKTDFASILMGDFVVGHTHLSHKIQSFIDNQMNELIDEYQIISKKILNADH